MGSIDSRAIIIKLLANHGRYAGDRQAITICRYTTPEGGTCYHISYTAYDIKGLLESPFCNSIKVLWTQQHGLSLLGKAMLKEGPKL